MAKKYDPLKPHEVFSLNRIAKLTGINKDKLYNNSNGTSKKMNLSQEEKQHIKDIITDAKKDYFEILGE